MLVSESMPGRFQEPFVLVVFYPVGRFRSFAVWGGRPSGYGVSKSSLAPFANLLLVLIQIHDPLCSLVAHLIRQHLQYCPLVGTQILGHVDFEFHP